MADKIAVLTGASRGLGRTGCCLAATGKGTLRSFGSLN